MQARTRNLALSERIGHLRKLPKLKMNSASRLSLEIERRDPDDVSVVVVAQEKAPISGKRNGGWSAVQSHPVVPSGCEIGHGARRSGIEIASLHGESCRRIDGDSHDTLSFPGPSRPVQSAKYARGVRRGPLSR